MYRFVNGKVGKMDLKTMATAGLMGKTALSKMKAALHKVSVAGLNCIFQKRYVEVLTPGTCECDLIWKEGLCRCNQVKMKSY